MKVKGSLYWIYSFTSGCKGKMLVAILLAVIGVLCGMAPYFALAGILSGLIQNTLTAERIFCYVGIAVLGETLKMLFNTVSSLKAHRVAYHILGNIRCKLAEKMMRVPMGVMVDTPSGKLKAMVVDTVDKLEQPLAHMLPEITANVFTPLCIIILLFILDWRMALACMIVIPIGVLLLKDLSRFGRNYLDVGNYLEIKYPTLGVRFIAIQENVDTLKETGTEMMPFNNIFNEWYAAQTSKKIRAVWKNKAANGKRVSSSVPFGYLKNPQDKEDWLVDEPAADIVRKIYALCLDGRGPLQIAKQLEQEKVLIPSAYYASLGRKTRKQYTHPYAWDQKTVAGILANQQYTGCTVNFMTTTVSYKVHKTVYNPKDEWQIIPNTQPAIIDEDTWKRVQELRENRIRPTATGRTSLFSGKVFCADCGSKLHFCAAKSLNANQEHYRCANYKSGRGNCQIHYIRNVVLEKIVLEAINSLADFVRCYEPVFLYLMAQKDIVSKRTETNRLKSSIESGKRRIQDLDKLIERIYEDQVLGNISAERYARMSINYENEQRELVKRVDEDEKRLVSIEQTSLDLKILLKVLRNSTAFEELTPTLVNSLIRRIEVHNNDKSSGHCSVKVDIYFTAIGLIDIPTEDEIKSLMEKIQANPQEYRLTA